MPDTTHPSVVILGGGYGGIHAAKALDDVADVTLVDPKDVFVHNIAAWRALVEPEWADRILLPYEHLLARGRFLRDRAVAVDDRRVTLASGTVLEPDYLILATGSSYPFPAKIDEPDAETARARIRAAHEVLAGARRVLLVGAGPAGLELAGEIKATFPGKHVTIADSSDDILAGPYDQELRDELRRQLDEMGVELVLGSALRELPAVDPAAAGAISVTTEAGDELTADVWYRAFGVTPHTEYLPADLLDGAYVRVDENLRVDGRERVFAVGDISTADRDMAGFASAQAKVVVANIEALIAGSGELESYSRWPAAIAVPLGPEGGAGQLPGGDGIAGPEVIAEIKGRAMGVGRLAEMFDAAAPVT
jgi:NADH dehydrogenase FAD-containing subunit